MGPLSTFNKQSSIKSQSNTIRTYLPRKDQLYKMCPHPTMSSVTSLMHPYKMCKERNVVFIKEMVYQRGKMCVSSRPSPSCRCAPCQRLMMRMKKAYHVKSDWWNMDPWEAQMELAMRCVFEVVYGFISLDQLQNGTWLIQNVHKSDGHHQRLVNLLKKAVKGDTWYFPWLSMPINREDLLR